MQNTTSCFFEIVILLFYLRICKEDYWVPCCKTLAQLTSIYLKTEQDSYQKGKHRKRKFKFAVWWEHVHKRFFHQTTFTNDIKQNGVAVQILGAGGTWTGCMGAIDMANFWPWYNQDLPLYLTFYYYLPSQILWPSTVPEFSTLWLFFQLPHPVETWTRGHRIP